MCVFTWASCPPARAQMALVHTDLREHTRTRSGDHSNCALHSHMSNTLYMLLSVEHVFIVLLTARPVYVFMRVSWICEYAHVQFIYAYLWAFLYNRMDVKCKHVMSMGVYHCVNIWPQTVSMFSVYHDREHLDIPFPQATATTWPRCLTKRIHVAFTRRQVSPRGSLLRLIQEK